MLRTMLKSKINRATVTQADLLCQMPVKRPDGSTALQPSRIIGINGAAAHLVHPGDLVILIAYATLEDAQAREYQPRIVFVDADNRQIDLGSDAAFVPADASGLMSPR